MLNLLAQLFICQAALWTAPLTLDANNVADGTMEVVCDAEHVKGGSLEDLYQVMDKEIRATATIKREWEDNEKGYRGRQYEASWIVERAGETLAMRGYLGIWRDADEFLFDAYSRDVTGTGPAKNIKELYPSFRLEEWSGGLRLYFRTRMVVEKPAALPKKKFLDIVKREAEAEQQKSQAQWIRKIQETL